jgi:predicted dehydrogenase
VGGQVNYAIIGCGLIGKKRLAALPSGSRLAVACDRQRDRAEELVRIAQQGRAVTVYHDAVTDSHVDAVIVATVNATLAEITGAAIQAGKPVLVEKPAGVTPRQVEELIVLATKHKVAVRVGFNHRFHPAFLKAREIFTSGALGELMFVRGRYGHGGRVGYDREWRADPKLSGGGELMDQGVHLIDLSRWFLGDFTRIDGQAMTLYWDMPVDDNAFVALRTARGQVAWLHASCTEWKNLFSFEIYGREGKLHIEGLGGSYGTERLTFYKMLPGMGPPETTVWEFPRGDESWQWELREFKEDIRLKRTPVPGLKEAKAALEIVDKIYATHSVRTK